MSTVLPASARLVLAVLLATAGVAQARADEGAALEVYFRGGMAKGLPDDVLHYDRARDLRGGAQWTTPVRRGPMRLGAYLDAGQRLARTEVGLDGVWTERRWLAELGFVLAERLWVGEAATLRAGQQLGYLHSRYRSLNRDHTRGAQGRRYLRDLPIQSASPIDDPRHWLSVRASLELRLACGKRAHVVLAIELAYQWQLNETVFRGAGQDSEGAFDVAVSRHVLHPGARIGFDFSL